MVGDQVFVQDQTGPTPKRWSKSGTIVESLPHDSFLVRIDGSRKLSRRNRQFLRKFTPFTTDNSEKVATCVALSDQTTPIPVNSTLPEDRPGTEQCPPEVSTLLLRLLDSPLAVASALVTTADTVPTTIELPSLSSPRGASTDL